jgi:predicted transcriptional regulator
MAAIKRTKVQRDRQLVKMTKLWVLGHSQSDIAKKFGITQQQVSYDIKEIRNRLLPENIQEMKEARTDRMMELAMFKQEFLEEWERSKRDKEIQTQEKISSPGNGKNAGDRIKVAWRTEGKCGDPAFLNGALKVIQEECKIGGFYAPKKLEHSWGDKKTPEIQFIEVIRPGPGPVSPGKESPEPEAPPPAPPSPPDLVEFCDGKMQLNLHPGQLLA